MKKYISIENTKYRPTNKDYNHIEVRTDYVKGVGLVCYLQEGKLEKDGAFQSFSFTFFESKRCKIRVLEMSRRNTKEIEEAEKTFFEKHTDDILIDYLNNV